MNPPTCLSCRYFHDFPVKAAANQSGMIQLFACEMNKQPPVQSYPSLEAWIRTAESCTSYEVPPASLR